MLALSGVDSPQSRLHRRDLRVQTRLGIRTNSKGRLTIEDQPFSVGRCRDGEFSVVDSEDTVAPLVTNRIELTVQLTDGHRFRIDHGVLRLVLVHVTLQQFHED